MTTAQRKKMLNEVFKQCDRKNWSLADHLYDQYKNSCKQLWIEYDTHFNFRFNICGMWRHNKLSMVRPRWSDSENYPMAGQLTCYNADCKFYLVVNSDL